MFKNALPIWSENRENEMHLRLRFKAIIDRPDTTDCIVRLATSGLYNLYVNGSFVAYGPARAGRGHFRVDECDIAPFLRDGKNVVVIEICSYNVTSYYVMKQSAFLTAEIVAGDAVIAYTGRDFSAQQNPYYVQKIQRYSSQRHLLETYRIRECDTYLTDLSTGTEKLTAVNDGIYLPRLTHYPLYEQTPAEPIAQGTVSYFEPETLWRPYSFEHTVVGLNGFDPAEYEFIVTDENQKMQFTAADGTYSNHFAADSYALYKLPYNATGMLAMDVTCDEDAVLSVLFDEVLSDGLVDPRRMGCSNVIRYELCKGTHRLQFFEVYTMKYFQLVAAKGACSVQNVHMVEFKHPPVAYDTGILNPEMKKIADAAIETYRQNSVDLFTDCPSRERAGWLCDSFFLGRTEHFLTGSSIVEKSFLENFLHEENYPGLPTGMLPMCYPSDHVVSGHFIPQWTLWLILQLEEYLDRSGDRDLIDRFAPRIENLLGWFKQYENADGLLEKLPGWNFVEWSKANQLVQDVNYPTNMLYSGALAAASRLWSRPELLERSEAIKTVVRAQSLRNGFFVDRALRMEDGTLKIDDETTETCQYYAFYFGVATPEQDPVLWNAMLNDFGPQRDLEKTYPAIYPSNAFIGNYLRLDFMMRIGEYDKARENILGYFGYMAERTGTLWENIGTTASCNHGFASYVVTWLDKLHRN